MKIKYYVVVGLDSKRIDDNVNEMLKKGWELQGGVSVTCDDGPLRFAQAMIKIEEETND